VSSAKRVKKTQEPARYNEMMEELERILDQLESDSIDVDELSDRVKRASELIRLCRQRLVDSQTEIEQVVADLDTLDEDGEGDGELDDTDGQED
jgi:exodeoxyribonuclease VII small subunit